MKERAKKISLVICLACVFASLVILFIYFTFLNKENNSLKLTLHDIEIEVGKFSEIDYSISNQKATLSFSITNTEIAVIEDGKVKGLTTGVTYLRANATLGDKNTHSIAKITVLKSSNAVPPTITTDYYIELDVLSGGNFSNGTLYSTGTTVFKINLYDKNLTPVIARDITIETEGGVFISRELDRFYLTATASGKVYITISEYIISTHFNVELQ